MSPRIALLLLCLSWAALYLPALGDPELRGEEIRRILPAQGMLESGDWIVPRIAGEVYANKPPLINWAVAGMFVLTGSHSEFSARLVSSLSMLGLGLASYFLLRKPIGNEHALLVSLALLTTLTLISKGRLIEIEALFTALFGIACFLWIRLWTDERSPWLVWTLPYLFLGLGCLVKGPVHLLFWFPFLLGTLRSARQMRTLLHPAHFLGLLLMAGIFLPWVILNIRAVGAGEASVGNWAEELAIRGDVTQMEWDRWLTNPLKIPGGFLPWTVPLVFALLFLWKKRIRVDAIGRLDAVIRGGLIALAAGYLLICLLPGGVPRYLMPVYPLAALVTIELFFRTPETARARYEKMANGLNRVLLAIMVAAPLLMAFLSGVRPDGSRILLLVAGTAAVVMTAILNRTVWKRQPTFLHTAFLIAAGGIALLPGIQDFQGEGDLFRKAAAEIDAKTPPRSRVVYFADEVFRNRFTKHLRLLYYTREPSSAIGENGALPEDATLFVGLPESEAAMRAKLGDRQTMSESTIDVRRVSLLVWQLKPAS
ncbi:MAG: glycosyltransferase family 39 protein [Verrucomicrobiales bacterium]|nr:glycosyltransferase family 39 protein [Verrucomicrobiales bacterium]